MIKSTLQSPIAIKVLNKARAFVGATFDIDKDIAIPLKISHRLASRSLRDLRADGYISYWCKPDGHGRYIYFCEWCESIEIAKNQTEKDQLWFNF